LSEQASHFAGLSESAAENNLSRTVWHVWPETLGGSSNSSDVTTIEQVRACLHGPRYYLNLGGSEPTNPTSAGRWSNASFGTLHSHLLPPNAPRCRFHGPILLYNGVSSLHPGGANAAFVDGHVKFVSESIDRRVWLAAGTIAGGESAGAP
jgi:prepilin-type processing-associated H-X9-DG protein